MNRALFSSASDEWETPADFYKALDAEFHFTLDPCSTDENAKCAKHYTRKDDGLSKDWTGETVFCNPPYGREMPKWIAKCAEHAAGGGYGCYADTCKNGYKSFSRSYLWSCGDTVRSWSIEICRSKEQRPIPEYGCGIQRMMM